MPARFHSVAPYLLAALLGALVCLHIYGWDFVTGESAFWLAPHADHMQAITGWYGFRHDHWRFPLFDVKTLRYPQGANIVFTDSIPLLALVFKPLAPLLPERFHYFGWWMGLCFVLQPVSALVALRAWGVRGALPLAAVCGMVVSTPAWLIRHNHLALCGHFLVLLAIALYAYTQRTERLRWPAAAWLTLCAATTLVHLYLLAMLLALLMAAVAQRAWNHRANGVRAWLSPWGIPVGSVVVVLSVALLSGHFRGEAVQDASRGFGTYSMNLLQPFYPQGLLQLPVPLPTLDATGGQYEGFNYVGAGGLLLVLAVLLFAPKSFLLAARRHPFLLGVLFVLTLFALSNRVYFGETAVLKYRVPYRLDKPVELFRSSGRFFWPVGYVLVLGGIVLLSRQSERRRGVAAILIAMPLLQWVDAGPARDFPRGDTHRIQAPLLPPAIWEPVVREHSLVRTFPGFFCGPAENHRQSQEFQLLAARTRVPVTTVFMARQVDDCEAERALVDTLRPGERELVVYLPPFQREHAGLAFPNPAACRAFPSGLVCSRRFLEPGFRARVAPGGTEPYFRELVTTTPTLTPVDLGEALLFQPGGVGVGTLYTGWYSPEPEGVWMQGGFAELWVMLKEKPPADGHLRLRFRAKAYLSAKHPRKRLEVFVNGNHVAELWLETWQPVDREVQLPVEAARGDGPLRIQFAISPVSSPLADGVSQDPRELGIQLQRLVMDIPTPAGGR